MSIVDMNKFERDIGRGDPVPEFLRSQIAQSYAPPAVRDPVTMTETAMVHTTGLDQRVAAWLMQRATLSDEIRETIETADHMKRICLALQTELDSPHVEAVADQEAEPEA